MHNTWYASITVWNFSLPLHERLRENFRNTLCNAYMGKTAPHFPWHLWNDLQKMPPFSWITSVLQCPLFHVKKAFKKTLPCIALSTGYGTTSKQPKIIRLQFGTFLPWITTTTQGRYTQKIQNQSLECLYNSLANNNNDNPKYVKRALCTITTLCQFNTAIDMLNGPTASFPSPQVHLSVYVLHRCREREKTTLFCTSIIAIS